MKTKKRTQSTPRACIKKHRASAGNTVPERNSTSDRIIEIATETNSLLQSMLNAFVLFESVFDESGNFVSYRFLYINSAYEKITGVKSSDVIGKTVHEVWPGTEPEWIKMYGSVAVTGQPKTFEMHHAPTQKTYRCNVYRPWSGNDRFCVIFEDITERLKAENILRESEEQFKSLAENINIGVFRTTFDEYGRIIYANQALVNIYGAASLEEILSMRIVDLYLNPADRPALLAELSKKGQIKAFEIRLKNKKGEPVWCSVNARLVYAPDGTPAWIDGTLEDIQYRKQVETALKESEQRLATIIDFLPDATFAIDLHGTVIAWNKSMEDMTGIAAHDIMGKSYENVSVAFYGERRPLLVDLLFIDRKEIEKRYTWVKRFKNFIVGEAAVPHAYRGKGAYAWGIAGYLYNYEGAVSGAIESIRDITDRWQTEQALRTSREQLDLVIKGASLGTWDWNIPTGNLIVNERWANILGYCAGEIKPHIDTWKDMIHPDDAPEVLAHLDNHLQGTIPFYQSEHRLRTKTGEWRWVLDCGRVVERDPAGTPLRAAGVILDIHDRKTADEKLRAAFEELRTRDEQLMQADKLASLGTLVAGVAHEINNPNNFIMLNTPLIQDIWNGVLPVLEQYCREQGDFKVGGMPFSKVRDAVPALLSGILDGARRVSGIVRELKDFARPDEISLNQSVDVNAVVKAAVDLLHHTIQKATTTFSVSYSDNLPPVTGNPQRLEQVFVNLILNACQSLPEPSRAVQIATTVSAQSVAVTVRDEGIGIPEEHLEKIMDPFFTTKRCSGGTGLGLAISYKIIEQHGGRIDVRSRQGEGSVFTVLLPIHPERRRYRILVADDEEVMRDIIRKVLAENPAFDVEVVENGTEACMMLGKWAPDLLVLDINMPDINGVEVCRRIRQNPELSSLRVIVCTGHPHSKEMQEIRALGYTNMLAKPFRKEEMKQVIEAALKK